MKSDFPTRRLPIQNNGDLRFASTYEYPLELYVENVEKNICSIGVGLIQRCVCRSLDISCGGTKWLVAGSSNLLREDVDFAEPELLDDLNDNANHGFL